MKQLLSTSPHPVLRVGKDGTVLYANEEAAPLLEVWGTCTGKKLPSRILGFVRKVLGEQGHWNLEVNEGERNYSLTFSPLGEEYVHIHGLDISSGKKEAKKPGMQEKQYEALSRSGVLSLSSAGFRELLDNAAEVVASTLEVESCRILECLQEGTFYPHSLPSGYPYSLPSGYPYNLPPGREPEPGTGAEEPLPCQEFEGGICISFESRGSPRLLMTLLSLKPRDFAPEEVYFLRSVLDLVTKILECSRINQKLQNRIRFLETLLDTIPSPIYF